ncbi:hypothetical protein D0Y65_018655 [Glycine soja]|uniref:Uncharacterized protein n=1 Tax=Glycine soja TaxID=3848 RepID=A0A445K037_GLYSO|nr:hypothetical protein D0Y65_018655 [Glycine soja]
MGGSRLSKPKSGSASGSTNCFMLYARALSITWGDTPEYWIWVQQKETRSRDWPNKEKEEAKNMDPNDTSLGANKVSPKKASKPNSMEELISSFST